MGDGGQEARREDHPCRPAVQPDQRGGPPARADPGRGGHRVRRRPDQLRAAEREVLRRVRARLHERPGDHQRGLRGHRGSRRAVLRVRSPRTGSTTAETWALPGRRGVHRPAAPAAWSRAANGRCGRRPAARRTAPAAPPRTPTRTATTTLQHPRCVFQILKRHFARYTPEVVAEVAGVPEEQFLQVARAHHGELGTGPDHRVRVQPGLDPAHGGRAVHPHRGDPAGAAGQHGPSRRRHPGPARARLHPGLDRHPDPVRPAARLPADAVRARRRRPGQLRAGRERAERVLGQHPRLHGQPAEGLVGRRGHRGQRLLLRLPAPADRQPQHLRDGAGPDGGDLHGVLPVRPEPGGRLGQRADAADGPGQPGLAGGPRPGA